MERLVHVVHEDPDFLVVHKPAGLVCHPTKGDAYSSFISCLRLSLPQDCVPQMINRLDRETSGLMIIATRADAALGLRRLWEARAVDKQYLAVVHGDFSANLTVIDAPLGKDLHSLVAIKDCVRPDGVLAITEVERLSCFTTPRGTFSLVRASPRTGRKHQIRIHLAHTGHALVGDKLYSGDEGLYLDFVRGALDATQRDRLILPYHALHAGRLSFDWRGQRLSFWSPPEAWFTEFVGHADSSLRFAAANVPGLSGVETRTANCAV